MTRVRSSILRLRGPRQCQRAFVFRDCDVTFFNRAEVANREEGLAMYRIVMICAALSSLLLIPPIPPMPCRLLLKISPSSITGRPVISSDFQA